MQAVDVAVFLEGELGLYFVIGISWRDHEIALRRAGRGNALFDRVFREYQAEAGAIRSRFAGRDVVNLEYEHRALLDQFGLAGPQNQRGFAGRPSDQTAIGVGGTLRTGAAITTAATRGEEFV